MNKYIIIIAIAVLVFILLKKFKGAPVLQSEVTDASKNKGTESKPESKPEGKPSKGRGLIPPNVVIATPEGNKIVGAKRSFRNG